MSEFGMGAKDLEDVLVQGISFRPDGLIELTYVEARDATETAQVFRTAIFERKLCETSLDEIESDLRDLVDEVATAIRNPPKRLGREKDEDDEG